MSWPTSWNFPVHAAWCRSFRWCRLFCRCWIKALVSEKDLPQWLQLSGTQDVWCFALFCKCCIKLSFESFPVNFRWHLEQLWIAFTQGSSLSMNGIFGQIKNKTKPKRVTNYKLVASTGWRVVSENLANSFFVEIIVVPILSRFSTSSKEWNERVPVQGHWLFISTVVFRGFPVLPLSRCGRFADQKRKEKKSRRKKLHCKSQSYFLP